MPTSFVWLIISKGLRFYNPSGCIKKQWSYEITAFGAE